MSGVVALVGGSEHTPGCEAADRLLLRISGVRRPEVAVILAASPQWRRPFKQDEAQRWWATLGARARCAFAGEDDPVERSAALLEDADLVVLTGGRPWLLNRRLHETALGRLLLDRWRQGVPISGSSAGAMALGERTWSLRAPRPLAPRAALGLVPRTLIAPHAGRHVIDTSALWTQQAHPGLHVIGIPDRTALIVQPAGDTAVVGLAQLVSYVGNASRQVAPATLEVP